MEKVIPAGANRLGYESETLPVVMPFMGSMFARAFTATIPIYAANANIFTVVLLSDM